ncbi:hypothetical protein [Streptomyces sp. NPDC052012]|uniref:hypothetical protein n=1 Tax=Streptomyces sp. NPDC052012 TaxID=3155051 RepID=UPI00344F8E40
MPNIRVIRDDPPVSARRVRAGARHERFVTQRSHGADAEGAGRVLGRLPADLDGLEVLGVERESVLHDSDVSMGDGRLRREFADRLVRAATPTFAET